MRILLGLVRPSIIQVDLVPEQLLEVVVAEQEPLLVLPN